MKPITYIASSALLIAGSVYTTRNFPKLKQWAYNKLKPNAAQSAPGDITRDIVIPLPGDVKFRFNYDDNKAGDHASLKFIVPNDMVDVNDPGIDEADHAELQRQLAALESNLNEEATARKNAEDVSAKYKSGMAKLESNAKKMSSNYNAKINELQKQLIETKRAKARGRSIRNQVYSIGANGENRYFESSDKKLDFMADLMAKGPTIPYEDGKETDILIIGREQAIKNNSLCNNFDSAGVTFNGRRPVFNTTLTPDEKKKLFEIMGANPEDDHIICNGMEAYMSGNELMIRDIYRIKVSGLSESDLDAIDENICIGQNNVLSIKDWRKSGHGWEGRPPVIGEKKGSFYQIEANSRFVNFSWRDYTIIEDKRSKKGNSNITFFDGRTEFNGR